MTWIQTFTGRKFHPLNPMGHEIYIEDIAHHLAMKCRFAGAVNQFYSVAEHSVRVSKYLETFCGQHGVNLFLFGLLHDAAEAYLPDVCRPIKGSLIGFQQLEDRLLDTILKRYGLRPEFTEPLQKLVDEADFRLCATEARDLMTKPTELWDCPHKPLDAVIEPWCWEKAEFQFLERFSELY